MRLLRFAGILLGCAISLITATAAIAESCSDVTSGGRKGPSPNWNNWPFGSDVCYVDWPGGHRAERERYESQCKSLSGAEFIQFSGDFGSNRNTCIYRPLNSSGRKASAEANSCEKRDISTYWDKLIDAELKKDWQSYILYTDLILIDYENAPAECKESMTVVLKCRKAAAEILQSPSQASASQIERICPSHMTTGFVAEALRLKQQARQPAPVVQPTPLNQPTQRREVTGCYGAYVHVASTRFYGISRCAKTEREAIRIATEMCRVQQDNGITTGFTAGMDTRESCDLIQVVNDGCLSVALRDGRWGVAEGTTKQAADREAVDSCGDRCKVSHPRSFCSTGTSSASSSQQSSPTVSPPSQMQGRLHVCNRDNAVARVALVFRSPQDGKWVKQGWFSVSPGGCARDFHVGNGLVYLYATSDAGSGIWGGEDLPQCLPYKAFKETDWSPRGQCTSSERFAKMRRITNFDVSSDFTYNLNP